jgi:hypothetical protein
MLSNRYMSKSLLKVADGIDAESENYYTRCSENLNLGPLILGTDLKNCEPYVSRGESNFESHLLHTHGTHLVSSINALINGFTNNVCSEKTAGECVPRTIRVNDFVNLVHRVYFGAIRLRR